MDAIMTITKNRGSSHDNELGTLDEGKLNVVLVKGNPAKMLKC